MQLAVISYLMKRLDSATTWRRQTLVVLREICKMDVSDD